MAMTGSNQAWSFFWCISFCYLVSLKLPQIFVVVLMRDSSDSVVVSINAETRNKEV